MSILSEFGRFVRQRITGVTAFSWRHPDLAVASLFDTTHNANSTSTSGPEALPASGPHPAAPSETGDPRMKLSLKDMPKHGGIPQRRLDGDWYVSGEMRDHYSGGTFKSRWNKKGEHFVGGIQQDGE